MSVENYIRLYADDTSELIELMQMLYPFSPNESTNKSCFFSLSLVHISSASRNLHGLTLLISRQAINPLHITLNNVYA